MLCVCVCVLCVLCVCVCVCVCVLCVLFTGDGVLQRQAEDPGAPTAAHLGGAGPVRLAQEGAGADQTAPHAGAGEVDHRV